MKIIDDYFPNENTEISLSKMTIVYTQNLDCCQSESEYPEGCQQITMTTDDGGGGKFIRFNTDKSGWSISDINEIKYLFEDFYNRLKCD